MIISFMRSVMTEEAGEQGAREKNFVPQVPKVFKAPLFIHGHRKNIYFGVLAREIAKSLEQLNLFMGFSPLRPFLFH